MRCSQARRRAAVACRAGYVRRCSDMLAIFLLKARRPEKYQGRIATEHTGAGGGPIAVTWLPPQS